MHCPFSEVPTPLLLAQGLVAAYTAARVVAEFHNFPSRCGKARHLVRQLPEIVLQSGVDHGDQRISRA
jgi:hypothetical protein